MPIKVLIVAALAVTVVAVVMLKQGKNESQDTSTAAEVSALADAGSRAPLPRLLDLGADKCIPCRQMAPILEELKKEYAGRMDVHFIDVWKNPDAGKAYRVEMIPTQIFFDAERQGAVPAHGVLWQGGHSGQVEGTRRGAGGGRKEITARPEIDTDNENLIKKLSHNQRWFWWRRRSWRRSQRSCPSSLIWARTNAFPAR